ncbi:CRISPR-associated helicase Cas3 [Lyngbya aestuarii BL J]|uniref:CRISPR-associated helicase Cas3 n=1 Tax=Lyngbya aestuarii BL J TaxID=1348334 RepID=U7QK91_9CYAN|nr:CRISPR-associated helicase Cas3' [Lyngbya aestuarii]ERT07692.1 CRISPR-associated helicase Cas3 [Lyngbya aestuarii BL J]
MNINQQFHSLTNFSPRQFQQETISKIINSENVILRAPTGSGKTETAIAPFLFSKAFNLDFPNKLIYVVPLRTLANSLRLRVENLVHNWSKQYPDTRPLIVTLQTGENPEDPRFEGDIIFCTIDQVLSSFLNIPFSVGRGSANVNAGSIFASYLVFDELHLLDADRAFTTAIKVLKEVQGISQFLLMTATLTDELATKIKQEIKATKTEIVRVGDEDLAQIENNRCRTFQAISEPLTADVICDDIQKHNRKRVIVICNTVSQAQGLFKYLEDLNINNQFKITLLHSRFLASDRTSKERQLQDIFSQNCEDDGYCHILISTQVIEAGMNITCEVMHSQLCPMNSLLQRVGRCARFAGEQGEVYIYKTIQTQLDEDELDAEAIENSTQRKKRKYPPYPDELCEQTWEILINHTNSEQQDKNINFRIEEDWINQIHTVENIQQAERRQNQKDEFERNWEAAIFRGDKSVASELIRFIDSRSVFLWKEQPIILGEDDEENTVDVSQLDAFSIPIGTLCKVFKETQEEAYRLWGCAFHRIEPPQKGKEETYSQDSHSPIGSICILRTSARILLNSKYAYYDRNIGLVMGKDLERFELESSDSELNQSQKKRQVLKSEYQYKMDTYVGHLGCMWTCWRKPFKTEILKNGILTEVEFSSVRNELFKPGGKFIQSRIFPNASTEQSQALFEILVFLAILTHDLGKLQQKWQDVMQGWQTLAYQQFKGKNPKQFLIAHTDYDPTIPEQKAALKTYEKSQRKRPNHAIESAYLSKEILKQSLIPILKDCFEADREQMKNICWVILMATGRHHSAWTSGWKADDIVRKKRIELHPQAKNAIAESWCQLGRFLPNTLPLNPTNLSQTCYDLHELKLDIFSSDETEYQQLYTLVVRALRLCDQRSVQ